MTVVGWVIIEQTGKSNHGGAGCAEATATVTFGEGGTDCAEVTVTTTVSPAGDCCASCCCAGDTVSVGRTREKILTGSDLPRTRAGIGFPSSGWASVGFAASDSTTSSQRQSAEFGFPSL